MHITAAARREQKHYPIPMARLSCTYFAPRKVAELVAANAYKRLPLNDDDGRDAE